MEKLALAIMCIVVLATNYMMLDLQNDMVKYAKSSQELDDMIIKRCIKESQ